MAPAGCKRLPGEKRFEDKQAEAVSSLLETSRGRVTGDWILVGAR